jgi:hypothetical protein
MKNLALVLLVAGGLVVPGVAVAKGSGGHGGGHSGGHASGHASASHGSSGRSSPSSSRSTPSTHGTATSRGANSGSTSAAAGANAAPGLPSDRARNGRPSTGTAVPRLNPTSRLLSSRYPSRVFLTTGFRSFGLYGLYFDPLLLGSYGYGYPMYGYGYPMYGYGYPMYGYGYGDQYGYAPGNYYGYAPYSADLAGPTGGLRLKIEPKDAEVFVDGSYAGIVDDFDGVFQHLTLAAGPHHIEVRSTGYRPLEFDMMTEPHKTTTIRDVFVR